MGWFHGIRIEPRACPILCARPLRQPAPAFGKARGNHTLAQAAPHSFHLFQKAERQLDKTHGKVRAYNETMQRLEKRIGKVSAARKKLPLAASLARISGLKETAEREIKEQSHARNALAQHLYDWRNTLPELDGQIEKARRRPRG